jgi:serine/threonine protein kinase
MYKCCFNICSSNKVVAIEQNNNEKTIEKGNFNELKYNPIFLGTGVTSNTYKININNLELTCKKIKKKEKLSAYREVEILKSLDYEHYLPVLYKAIETPSNIYILYSFIEGIDIFEMLKNPTFPINTNESISTIIREIALGLHSLFTYNYVHLDIKFENIIIQKTKPIRIKLIDLAFCEKLNCKNKLATCGTNGYASPEIILYNRFFHNSDIWSLGIIMYGLLTNKALFPINNYKISLNKFSDLKTYLNTQNPLWLGDDNVKGVEIEDLLNKMLTKNPAYRLSIKGVLNHKFIKNKDDDNFIEF